MYSFNYNYFCHLNYLIIKYIFIYFSIFYLYFDTLIIKKVTSTLAKFPPFNTFEYG